MGCRLVARVELGLLAVVVAASLGSTPASGASTAERLADDAYLIRDDSGNWGGPSKGITHQRGPNYQAKKRLDLADVPEEFWRHVTEVRLSAFFCVRDYSEHDLGKANGLDETLEIVVNEHVIAVPTKAGLPAWTGTSVGGMAMRWHEFRLPKEYLLRGPNEIVFRLAAPAGKKPDDYLYLGIDSQVPSGRSWGKLSAASAWHPDKLNALGATGEYMVRLVLLAGTRELIASWEPGQDPRDPAGVIQYAGTHSGRPRIEWDLSRLDRSVMPRVTVETAGGQPIELWWLYESGLPLAKPAKGPGPKHMFQLGTAATFVPSGVQLAPDAVWKRITLQAAKGYQPPVKPVDMAPAIAAPAGKKVDRTAPCRREGDQWTLENPTARAVLTTTGGRLRLKSLYNELAGAEMVRDADASALWLVEVDGRQYAGERDFALRDLRLSSDKQSITATCMCEAIGLEAQFTASADLCLGLTVTNRSGKPLDFKLAFPHLSGLAVSQQPADDYYFYPFSGLVSNAPALIRYGYGDHQALYQVLDLFSPQRGAGLSIACTDNEGWYKVLALRKHVPGRAEVNADLPRTPTADEFKWSNSLPAVPGIGLTFEYLRRTRAPGESFQTQAVQLHAHAGDWHTAMEDYAAWCHRQWKFRPHPSRLDSVWNMIAAGWGKNPLFRDGRYNSEFIKPRCDCIELMSWWEWAPLGPWRTSWDKLEERIGAALYKRYSNYWVKDPVTGQTMYPLNRGDYDGYNQRWGGLPALQQAIKDYRKSCPLVTLYTDPLLADDNTRCGQQWGKLWGIVKPDGSYRTNYESWNMCHDVAEYRQYVAETMKRVLRETGADGIRLDEYGHCGAACFNKQHKHTFAEWGCTEWQKAIAETSRLVRQGMDEVDPGSVLTTEHPGYDYLLPHLEGCITYDLTVLKSSLRPLECNLQRFYFPECKAYELDHRGADRKHRKRFWNAVGSFGSYYPEPLDAILRENQAAFSSRDCRPLVPTLMQNVYANRFAADEKTIYTLYNATGHSVAGPMLRLPRLAGHHAVELLSGRELRGRAADDGLSLEGYIPRDEVLCVAWLPKRLKAASQGRRLKVEIAQETTRGQIVLCGAEGKRLLDVPAKQPMEIDLGELPDGQRPVCVKLLSQGQLVDCVGLP